MRAGQQQAAFGARTHSPSMTWQRCLRSRASPATTATARTACRSLPTASATPVMADAGISRRDALLSAMLASGLTLMGSTPGPAAAATTDSFFPYVPIANKTPAIRAGLIREPFYTMAVPSTWKEAKIPNILSGNFCMPGCGEPWTEVVFENPSEGKLQLLVSPLVKLTNKKDVPIQELGTPESILPRIGGYITGTYMEEEDLVTLSSKVQDDGLTYYYYELYAPAANGHSLTAVTTKGENCYLFVTSAPDKAWKNSEALLRKTVEAFRA